MLETLQAALQMLVVISTRTDLEYQLGIVLLGNYPIVFGSKVTLKLHFFFTRTFEHFEVRVIQEFLSKT